MPIDICAAWGRPPCWGVAGAVGVEGEVGSAGEGSSVAVGEAAVVEVAVTVATNDVVLVVIEDDVMLVEKEEVVDSEDIEYVKVVCVKLVVVETVALDTPVKLWPTQYGDSASAPMQVCPSAQQIEPHWKSPAAQTRVHPAPPAPAGQQEKAPLLREHVSPAPPGRERSAMSPWRGRSVSEHHLQHHPACGQVVSPLPQVFAADWRFQSGAAPSPGTAGQAGRNRNAAGATKPTGSWRVLSSIFAKPSVPRRQGSGGGCERGELWHGSEMSGLLPPGSTGKISGLPPAGTCWRPC
jgi:hypothetical protein